MRLASPTCSMSTGTPTSSTHLLNLFLKAIPPLDGRSYKGQHGRIGIVGGSADYIGSHYFAAMGALRVGADLVTIFCPPDAAIPLRLLSPDAMVLPSLAVDQQQLKNIRALVIGPGLGRNPDIREDIITTLTAMVERDIPLVLDSDALWWVENDERFRKVVQNATLPIITPNAPEAARLQDTSGFACIAKGREDYISVGNIRTSVANYGSPKRAGGQGDILAGITALFASWVHNSPHFRSREERTAAAAVAASIVTRRAASLAFDKHGRSLVASDILNWIGTAVSELEHGRLRGESRRNWSRYFLTAFASYPNAHRA